MKTSRTSSSILFTLFLISALFSDFANSSIIEFRMVDFPSGRPYKSESVTNLSAILDKEQMKGLEQTLEVLKGRSDIKVKVVGYADENECHISDCQNLSFRRAKFVFDWLLEHGVPSEQLKGPEGLSTTWPLYRNATEKERVFNQRVDFEIYACCQLESVN